MKLKEDDIRKTAQKGKAKADELKRGKPSSTDECIS